MMIVLVGQVRNINNAVVNSSIYNGLRVFDFNNRVEKYPKIEICAQNVLK